MKKYFIHTYGCQMNLHESEKVAGVLVDLGYAQEDSEDKADIIVFNTCCIRDTAEKRAFGNIGVVKRLKKINKNLIIVVLGCMTKQDGYIDIIKQKYPYVDIVLGTRNIDLLKDAVTKKLEERKKTMTNDFGDDYLETDEKLPMFRDSYPNAWVNIIYGCNNFCSYCIVPYVRGREISRSMDDVLKEVRQCVADGYKEITLLGQNVNSYGNDLTDGTSFEKLLREIDKIDGKFRVRFMTSHPKDLTEGIVDAIANSKKICNNIHLPVQAGSNSVLSAMNRRYTREHYFSLIEMIRSKIPDCGITTDIMVGFPTETDNDFLDTVDLVKRCRFSNAFTFIYSPRKGTVAEKMEQLPYSVKQARIMELIKIQNQITKELSKEYKGNVYEILVEDVQPKSEGYVCGRTESGRLVSFKGDKSLIGSFVNVKIETAKSASLFGSIVGDTPSE
ncbi:MAG: tRNA (N6-isopentenyl adenosine(37)-C2)-methylthiotransferase MiaB [Firmicutes bacterium]|nr:tRNA (N6-isopentenyl adenosine(37)-C2)-methylthiotransferase MiaB [Bacillota bacterium]